MPSWLPSISYGAPSPGGYWDPVTSTINWCEEDYYATHYAAEIVNTLTNLLFVYLAYLGIRSCRRNAHDAIFLVSFIGYLLVGTGSFLFHATLKYPMQLVDELSMIYTTCLMCYATFSYAQSRPFRIYLALALVGLAVFITLYYHYLQDPAFHQIAFAILTAVVLLRAMYVMEITLRPRLRMAEERFEGREGRGMTGREKEVSRAQGRRDWDILGRMWMMIAVGLSVFLGGFCFWHLDNVYCKRLRGWRREVGLPWGVVLEGHGWWHLMTGTGAYFYITWGIWLRHCLNGKQDEYDLKWDHIWHLPEVVRTNAVANGDATKKKE
ncbi:hypothetical protein MMC21_001517 [Puttea exsequens]|nr:hypothetical protein [Puttea exsequens]